MMRILLTAAAMSVCVIANANAEPDAIFIETAPVANGLTFVRAESPLGNQSSLLFQSGEDVLLVDANITEIIPLIIKEIGKRKKAKLRYVVTSHHHGDHTQGLESLGERVISIAPERQRERMATEPLTTP